MTFFYPPSRFCSSPGRVQRVRFALLAGLAGSALILAADSMARSQQLSEPATRFLEAVGVAPQQLRDLEDGADLQASETPLVDRVMDHLGRLAPGNLDRLRSDPRQLSEPNVPSAGFRGRVFRLTGTVHEIGVYRLLESDQPAGGGFRTVIKLPERDWRAVVYARHIPSWWTRAGVDLAIGQPATVDGWLLKGGPGARPLAQGEFVGSAPPSSSPGRDYVFLADRVGWLPTQSGGPLSIPREFALLGEAGFDLGLLDRLSSTPRLTGTDGECFYALLATMARVPVARTAALVSNRLDITRLLRPQPADRGRMYRLTGTARRALRILLEPELRRQYGIDHYYEIDLFVPLPQTLKLLDPATGQERSFDNYPMTVCVAQLPDGMAEGEDIRETIEVQAVYLKTWRYTTLESNRQHGGAAMAAGSLSASARVWQISPLFVGHGVRVVQVPVARNRRLELMWGLGFVALVAFLWLAVWRTQRRDRRARGQTRFSFFVGLLRSRSTSPAQLTRSLHGALGTADQVSDAVGIT